MPDRRLVALVLASALALPAGAGGGEVTDDRAQALERLVVQDCGSCHGLTLKGGLGPDIRAETLAGTEPESLAAIILDGVPGTAMPPWRPLISEEDARWIAEYLLATPAQ
ncbi:cytochrome c [Limibaculum sp. M0105]|uniref:Cytochrome c n=1 Tax=Thermohalobaculum xanthum TaxID=2753746 RepID=A0A8J7M830_9RHOB|nr:cytochrome c [Thermohalobaculum xanthum]MBK0399465.1 cytochrome c [Thermohalobaculum xanthum]